MPRLAPDRGSRRGADPGALCRAQIVYGVAFLVTSATRLTLVFSLPIDTAVWVSAVALPAGITVAVLGAAPFTGRAAALVEAEVAGTSGGARRAQGTRGPRGAVEVSR